MRSEKARVIPQIFSTLGVKAQLCPNNLLSKKFNFQSPGFASLGTRKEFERLKSFCQEIDIKDEMEFLKEDHALEITVPVQGLIDILGNSDFSKDYLSFPHPLLINGYGAKDSDNANNNFPKADFVLITDIGGNQYEALINKDGKIELPKDGTGLFSLVKAITFIFNENQVKNGFGLEEVSDSDSFRNKIYLLGPSENNDDFVVRVCVTHINEHNKRIVDTIRSVKITYPKISYRNYQSNALVNRKPEDSSDKLTINLALLLLLPLAAHHAFAATVTIEQPKDVKYGFGHQGIISLPGESHGWTQHPVHSNVFTKHFGLSDHALNLLIKDIYSEYDLMKDFLKGDSFSLSHQNGYNNFLLIPEAIGNFYDKLNYDIVHHKIPGDFLFDRVPEERLIDNDFSHLPVDFHDSIVLSQIHSDLLEHQFGNLKKLFLSEDNAKPNEIMDHFTLYATGLTQTPHVTVEISHGNSFAYDSQHDLLHTNFMHEQSQHVLNLHDIMEMPMTDHLSHQQGLDLHHMLEAQVTWTPLMSKEGGKEIVMTVTEENGAPFHATTQVQTQALTQVEIDPNHIHTHF